MKSWWLHSSIFCPQFCITLKRYSQTAEKEKTNRINKESKLRRRTDLSGRGRHLSCNMKKINMTMSRLKTPYSQLNIFENFAQTKEKKNINFHILSKRKHIRTFKNTSQKKKRNRVSSPLS